MGVDINALLRKNIRALTPYSSARDEYSGAARIFLDANENPFQNGLNRYPDPYQLELKQRLGEIKGIDPDNIFIGNGSDEAIDLLIRAFCEPGIDSIAQLIPTYGMYKVCADIQGVEIINIPLDGDFEIDVEGTLNALKGNTKLLFLCSPNNPTGNSLDRKSIEALLDAFNGIVVVDEAYGDFSDKPSLSSRIRSYPNLVVLQTLSKAWGLAGIRMGLAISSKEVIAVLNKIKYPYNVNQLSIDKALEVLNNAETMDNQVKEILSERKRLAEALEKFDFVREIFPSDTNFLLVRFDNSDEIFTSLMGQKIIVRDRSKVTGLDNCLRITVGTPQENDNLIEALSRI